MFGSLHYMWLQIALFKLLYINYNKTVFAIYYGWVAGFHKADAIIVFSL